MKYRRFRRRNLRMNRRIGGRKYTHIKVGGYHM